jgi:hypothetical protein
MKTSVDHIQGIIKDLLHFFPNVKVRYDHDKESDTHTLEVVPNEVYHKDESFNDWQGDAIMSFIELFPDESICFVTDDSLLGLTTHQQEYLGMFYGQEIKPQPIYDDYAHEYAYYVNDLDDFMNKTYNSLFLTSAPLLHSFTVSMERHTFRSSICSKLMPSTSSCSFRYTNEHVRFATKILSRTRVPEVEINDQDDIVKAA